MRKRWRAASESAKKKGISPSSADYWHYVTLDTWGSAQDFKCTCRGFTNHNKCWHVTSAREYLQTGVAPGLELVEGSVPNLQELRASETKVKVAQLEQAIQDMEEVTENYHEEDHILNLAELLKW